MIDLLDRYLRRLLDGAGADAAVIWSRTGQESTGSVVFTRPAGLVAVAAPWPVTDATTSAVIHRDPAVVAGLVPVSLRLELPRSPRAASSLTLADADLVLLIIWYDDPPDAELDQDLRALIAEEISYAARNLAGKGSFARASQRLEAVIGELRQGVVSVDHSLDQVSINPAAAQLLDLEPGEIRAAEFAAAMAALESRALNQADIAGMGRQLLADSDSDIECTWRFALNPTHVRVTSHAVRQGAYIGRVWVFEDVSIAAQALSASESAKIMLRASTDSMLDPQVLLEAVRDSEGRVVDFRYLSANRAACAYLGFAESDLIGRTQLENSPNLEGTDLQRRYFRCLEDGQPVILEDLALYNEILKDARRYDIQATRAGADLLTLTWRDVTERFQSAQRIAESEALLRSSADNMINPQVLFEAVRGADGRIVDFLYRRANKATLSYLGVTEQELVGASALETLPNLEGSGLLASYARCVETGEPVVLHDFSYFNEILDDDRRYDIQATRTSADLLTLTWSDVTERFHAARRIAESELQYRLIAENTADVVSHIRDDRFVWISPSVEGILGAPAEYWLGRGVWEIIPTADTADHAARAKTLQAGGVFQGRARVKSLDGHVHWAHLHARPFYDAEGRPDGLTASFRLIDDEVAAEQQAEKARRQQARAEARFRRSMNTAAIGMCIVAPDGALVEVNAADVRVVRL